MPVLVRNNKPGCTVFTDKTKDLVVEWQGRGDSDGEDVQQVPDDMLKNMAFLRAVRSNILSVIDDSPETQELLARQGIAYQQRQADSIASTEALMDRNSEAPIGVYQVSDDSGDPADLARMRNVGIATVIHEGTGLDSSGAPASLSGAPEVTREVRVVIDSTPLPSQQ